VLETWKNHSISPTWPNIRKWHQVARSFRPDQLKGPAWALAGVNLLLGYGVDITLTSLGKGRSVFTNTQKPYDGSLVYRYLQMGAHELEDRRSKKTVTSMDYRNCVFINGFLFAAIPGEVELRPRHRGAAGACPHPRTTH
jgi:hypothetical protein